MSGSICATTTSPPAPTRRIEHAPDPARLRAAAPARPARVAPAARPAAPAGDARAGGGVPDRARRGDAERHRGRSELLRPPPGGVRRDRAGADVRGVAARLLALARAALSDLRPAAGNHPARAGGRRRDARDARLDRAAVLQLPAVRARQGAADRGAGGLPGRPHAPHGPRHDGADHAARPPADAARDRRAGPRLGDGLRRGHAGAAVRGGRAVEALRGARGAVRGGDRARAGGGADGRACRCSSRTRSTA